jgi:hypothetical protein
VGKSERRGYGRRQRIEWAFSGARSTAGREHFRLQRIGEEGRKPEGPITGRGVTGLGANASGEARGNGPLGFAGVTAVQARLRRSGAPLRLLHLTPTRCPLSRWWHNMTKKHKFCSTSFGLATSRDPRTW